MFTLVQSRLSPFANTRARKGTNTGNKKSEKKSCRNVTDSNESSESSKSKISERWFSLIDAATLSQKRALLPVKKLKYSLQLNRELHRTLYGLIIFEVSWDDVRGINYVNELQVFLYLCFISLGGILYSFPPLFLGGLILYIRYC